jgi:hypothetical protein
MGPSEVMTRMNRSALFFFLCAMLASALASAQIPLGPEFQVDTGAFPDPFPYFDTSRSAAMAPNGDFVVVWTTGDNIAVMDVVARRFDALGVARGPEFLVNTDTAGTQYDQAVGMDGDGDFVVVWTGPLGVDGRRFDSAGTPLGAEFPVSGGFEPSIAVAPDGSFVVVWMVGSPAGSNNEVFGRRYDAGGVPVGAEFQVNTYTTGNQRRPTVAGDAAGNFVVVWESYSAQPVVNPIAVGRRYSAAGVPVGGEFMVSSSASDYQRRPIVASGRDGSSVVAWRGLGANNPGVFARRFDAAGNPVGLDFRVEQHTTAFAGTPDIAVDAQGDFVITWWYGQPVDGSGNGVFARRFHSSGSATGTEFRINSYATGNQWLPSIAGDPTGNFVVAWFSDQNGADGVFAQRYAGGPSPAGLLVDYQADTFSDGNGVLEPNEDVKVAPAWLNGESAALTLAGALFSYGGPGPIGHYPPPTDPVATYGTVNPGETRSCVPGADCYGIAVLDIGSRPAMHWDARMEERLAPVSLAAEKTWTLHVGDSFDDVPRASVFYRFVETLLHRGVTGGCTASEYCPSFLASREQMAVFVLVAKDGAGNVPSACTTPVFADVPASSAFCPWIEELARRGVVAGCGGGNYCPTDPVTREQITVFVLATKDPGVVPPACGAPLFNDVPASSPFCRWIEEMARRNVVTGCGGGNYCPASPVTREQMAVFISAGFGLQLYGP